MNRTDRVWTHVDRAFEKADEAFNEAGKAFTEAGRLFDDLPPNGTAEYTNGKVHTLHFKTTCVGERFRLSKKFFKLAVAAMFTGSAKLSFKDRQ